MRDQIKEASGAFAIDTLAYALMSNHLHLVLRTMPDRVADWSDAEVIILKNTVELANVSEHNSLSNFPVSLLNTIWVR